MTTTITVAYDRRHWALFTVKDATAEEIATLSDDTDEAVLLAKALDQAGRLTYVDEDEDDSPEYFNVGCSSVIDLDEEED